MAQRRRISKKRRSRRLPVHLTEPERDQVLEAARASAPRGVKDGALRDTAIIALGVYAGLRVSEITGLDQADVDLEALVVRIRHGKGDKDREVPLHQKAARAVAAYLDTRGDGEPALFLSRRGRRLSVRAIQRMVLRLVSSSELRKKVTPHRLRHTFATIFLDNNPEDIRTLQHLLGHASLTTTEIYTFVSHAKSRRAVDNVP